MRVDYYQLLDVPESAGAAEIKAAFRRQAMRFHPDRNEGNPAAEERFKLVAEAYRTLGDPARRAEYDGWLARQKRLRDAPELASMPRRTRVSVRHARERRGRRPVRRARVSPMLLKPRSKWIMAQYLAFCVLSMFLMIAWTITCINRAAAAPKEKERPLREPGVSPLDEETQDRNLAAFAENMRRKAHAGNAEAQYFYGSFLFNGQGGFKKDRAEALEWWRKSADQGFVPAIQSLRHGRKLLESTTPPAEN